MIFIFKQPRYNDQEHLSRYYETSKSSFSKQKEDSWCSRVKNHFQMMCWDQNPDGFPVLPVRGALILGKQLTLFMGYDSNCYSNDKAACIYLLYLLEYHDLPERWSVFQVQLLGPQCHGFLFCFYFSVPWNIWLIILSSQLWPFEVIFFFAKISAILGNFPGNNLLI